MKIEDISLDELKKYIEIKGLSQEGNKKELCQTILNYVEQQVIKDIQQCWNQNNKPIEEQKEKGNIMNVNDEVGKDLQHYIKLHEEEKIELLEKYEDLQNKKQKLKDRIKKQQQTFLKLPNILRFNVGPEVSISKALLANYPDSLLYTLISSPIWFEQYKENQNKYYLNCSEEEMLKIFDFVRIGNISDSDLCKAWGFSIQDFSNTMCLELDNKVSEQTEYSKNSIHVSKIILDKEIRGQTSKLELNTIHDYIQMGQLRGMVYNDPMILNVGGKIFSISKSKLKNHENTYFAPLVSGHWELENNTHFIDRSSQHFDMIYYYLVHKEVSPNLDKYFKSLDKEDKDIFIQELDYYQLDQIINHLQYDFTESRILNKEKVEYVQTLYPGKWRLIPRNQITHKIYKTTVLIANIKTSNSPGGRKYSKLTLDFIHLEEKAATITFDCLEVNKRGITETFRFSHGLLKRLRDKEYKYEIYEKVI